MKRKSKKKRILAGLLAICMTTSILQATAFAVNTGADGTVFYGDINKDGKVDESDVKALKQYLAEYKNLDIDKKAADVNVDNVIDLKDLLLLEQKAAGLDVILGESVTVTFDSNGGTPVDAIRLCKGAALSSVVEEVPSTQKDGAVFAGWYVDTDTPFYAEDALDADVTVYAAFEEIDAAESLTISSFALEEQTSDLSFSIVTDEPMTADAVNAAVSLLVMDGTDPVELEVVQVSETEFTITAKEGFTEGASYQLVLPDGLHFEGKEDSIKTANFTIDKEEVDTITYNDHIIYIKDTPEMTYRIDGKEEAVDMLKVAVLSNRVQEEAVTGSFTYTDGALTVGDILCIYENTHPNDRKNTGEDYSEDAASYVEVTDVSGSEIFFRAINEENAEKIFVLPDTIPFSVENESMLPAEETGSIDVNDYDTDAWSKMEQGEAPEVNAGDFVVFYPGEFSEITEDTPVYYGEVTYVEGDTVQYARTTAEAITQSQELYAEQTLDGDTLLEDVDTEAIERQAEEQAVESGFAEAVARYLAQAAQETDGFQNMQVENMTAATADGRTLSAGELAKIGGSWELGEDVKVTALLDKSSKYFQDGISLALRIDAEFTVDAGEDGELKIVLSATFVEEISIDVDTHGNAKIKWYVIVPVLESLRFGASIDVKNYSAISVDVKVYSVEKGEEGIWEQLKAYTEDTEVGALLEKADELKEMITQAKDTADKINGYREDLEAVWSEISRITASGGDELTQEDYEGMLDILGQLNVTEELTDMLHLTDEEEMEAGMRNLMERYSEMLETESDWITLLEKEIFSKDMMVTPSTPVLAVGIKMDFVIKANINIALGANLEYVVGKRYSFWIDVVEKTSGSTTMDLLDEKFAFQFYVMGALGIKMGVKAEIAVGLFSTSLASIGVTAEFGPYLKLWGYFIYEYSKMRPANTNQWIYDERMMGALYLEFGLYLEVAFKAQVLAGFLEYNPTLYDQEFPLLTAGERKHHYEFGYEMEEDEVLLVNDDDKNSNNGIAMELPENYRLMKYVDLVEGNLEQEVCPYDHYIATLSNRNFHFDENTGDITVDVPKGVQYMECDLTLTWKTGKLEFSSRDISVTIPLVWTSLATDELNQRFTATVKVGNAEDGYTTVWSEREKKNTAFNLPSYEEVLDLIGYDKYDNNGMNLKYAGITGYGDQQTEGLTIYTDTTYYFDTELQEYTLTVQGVQKEDGTEESRDYQAFYGESFDVQELKETGTADPETETYTAYLKTEAEQNGNILDSDITRVIDKQFAREILGGTAYTAQYVDNRAKATFTFVGYDAGVDDKTVTVKKGTTPPDVISKELLGLDARVVSIVPGLGDIFADTTFVVMLEYYKAPRYAVTYHTNGGSDIPGTELPEGAVMIAPAKPEKTGYLFSGWYLDEGLTEAFDFANTRMPGYALDLYAKWTAKTYEVTLDGNEGILPEGQENPVTVTYGNTYEALPTPVRTGFKFLGWFTDRIGGTVINPSDTVTLSDSLTLYAHWEEKLTLSEDIITYEPGQGCVYDRESHLFAFEAAGVEKEKFEVYYKRQVLDNMYAAEARNAGTYDIKLVYPEDDTYKYFETVLTGVYIIEKADSSILNAPSVAEVYYGSVLPEKMVSEVDYIGDGALQYAVTQTVSTPEESDWIDGTVLYNLFDKKDYGNEPYLWVRLAEGENYKASEMKVSESTFAWDTKPKSLLFPEVFKYFVTIETGDKKSGLIQQAGTDSTINFSIEDTQTRKGGNGSAFNANHVDTFQLDVDAAKLYNNSYGTIPVSLSITQHGVGPDWFCDQFWFYRGKENPYVDGAGNIIGGVGDLHIVDHWFKNNDTYEYADMNGFIREITEWSGFDAADNTTSVDVTADADAFVWNWAEPGITDGNAELTYNPYEHLNAPELSVTFGNAEYDRYITQGIHDFTVDNSGLYQAMVENQDASLELTYTLEFKPVNGNASVTEETAKRTKTITFTCQDVEAQVPALTSMTYRMGRSAGMLYNSLADVQPAAISSEIQPGTNGTFDVVYRLDENAGIWAAKFAVNFDKDKVELQKYTVGNLFTEAEVTAPDANTTADGRYVFLGVKAADGQIFADTKETGTLATLTFKIKDTNLTAYPVTLDTGASQSINAEGRDVAAQVNSNAAGIRVNGNTEGTRKEDTITLSVSEGSSNIEKVQVQKDGGALEDITASYANGYKVTENGTYTFYVVLKDGAMASTSITYTNIEGQNPGGTTDPAPGEDNPVKDEHKEHTWDNGKVTKEATETETGIRTYTCLECGETKTEVIEKKQPPVENAVPTGDRNMILLWIITASAAAIGMVNINLSIKRRRLNRRIMNRRLHR